MTKLVTELRNTSTKAVAEEARRRKEFVQEFKQEFIKEMKKSALLGFTNCNWQVRLSWPMSASELCTILKKDKRFMGLNISTSGYLDPGYLSVNWRLR